MFDPQARRPAITPDDTGAIVLPGGVPRRLRCRLTSTARQGRGGDMHLFGCRIVRLMMGEHD